MMQAASLKPTGIDAVWYLVKDLKKSREFYEGLFGFEPASTSDYWVEYELSDGNAFGLVYDPSGFWRQCGGIMFAVADFERGVERVKELGAPVHMEGEFPVCFTAWCLDPDGNSFAIHRRKS